MNINGLVNSGANRIGQRGKEAAAGSSDNISGTKDVGGARSTRQMKGQDSLTMDDFLRLIAIQLQNQDMSSPMDNSEMMNQLVQMATVEAMASMTTQVGNSYAAGLLGHQVDVLYPDGTGMKHETGTITGINMSTYPLTIYLDDKKDGYPMTAIAFIGQNKLDDGEDPEGPGDGTEPEGPGDGTEPEGPGDGTEPEGPGDGTEPEGPGDGTEPEGPGDGTEPEGPGDGTEPEGPGDGTKPEDPEGPGDETKPEDPVDPTRSGNFGGSADPKFKKTGYNKR